MMPRHHLGTAVRQKQRRHLCVPCSPLRDLLRDRRREEFVDIVKRLFVAEDEPASELAAPRLSPQAVSAFPETGAGGAHTAASGASSSPPAASTAAAAAARAARGAAGACAQSTACGSEAAQVAWRERAAHSARRAALVAAGAARASCALANAALKAAAVAEIDAVLGGDDDSGSDLWFGSDSGGSGGGSDDDDDGRCCRVLPSAPHAAGTTGDADDELASILAHADGIVQEGAAARLGRVAQGLARRWLAQRFWAWRLRTVACRAAQQQTASQRCARALLVVLLVSRSRLRRAALQHALWRWRLRACDAARCTLAASLAGSELELARRAVRQRVALAVVRMRLGKLEEELGACRAKLRQARASAASAAAVVALQQFVSQRRRVALRTAWRRLFCNVARARA